MAEAETLAIACIISVRRCEVIFSFPRETESHLPAAPGYSAACPACFGAMDAARSCYSGRQRLRRSARLVQVRRRIEAGSLLGFDDSCRLFSHREFSESE